MVFMVLFLFTVVLFWNVNKTQPTRPGPTCDSYYYHNDLRVCPEKYEYDNAFQKCMPIGERGCTASAVPTTITTHEFTCVANRSHRRDRDRPCQSVISCTDGTRTHSIEGMCYKLTEDNTFVQVECMQVPGCRHLDAIHIPHSLNFDKDEMVHRDDFMCPLPDDRAFMRTTEQPCFAAVTCLEDNEIVVSCEIGWQCLDTFENSITNLCAPCWYHDRCRYLDAYSPVNDIAAAAAADPHEISA
jgi:hypothetical protein